VKRRLGLGLTQGIQIEGENMSYGQYMFSRMPHSISAGETSGVFLVLPSVYSDNGIIYVRDGAINLINTKPLYRIRFRLKGKTK
jgi:hypothetical protein